MWLPEKNFKGVVSFAIKQPSNFVMVYNFCNDCETSIPVAFAETVDETHFSVVKWINFASRAGAEERAARLGANEKNFIRIKRWRHDVWNVRLDRCVHLRKSSIDINKEARVLSPISAIFAFEKKKKKYENFPRFNTRKRDVKNNPQVFHFYLFPLKIKNRMRFSFFLFSYFLQILEKASFTREWFFFHKFAKIFSAAEV